jgi:hypothetical protein
MCTPNCGKGIVGKMIHGALGIAKNRLSLDQAPPAVIEERRLICRDCPHAQPCKTQPGKKCRCRKCGCILSEKTRLASEACPIGEWPSVDAN